MKWVVPFPAGGAIDVLARQVAQEVGPKLNLAIIIENRPGAGGNIGVDHVIRAPQDGNTLLVAGFGLATNGALFSQLAFDAKRDLVPVSLLGESQMVLVAGPSEPEVNSFQDLVILGRSGKKVPVFGHAGTGSSTHLALELLVSETGIAAQSIPYKGSSPAVSDLLGGQLGFLIDSPTVLLPHIRSGRVRPLGVTSRSRSVLLPAVPAIAEMGFPSYEVSPWYAVFAPRGVPAEKLQATNAAIRAVLEGQSLRDKVAALGIEAQGSSQPDLQRHLQSETTKWSKLIRERGIRAE